MFLSAEDLTMLTGFKRRSAQVEALRFMGIEHRVRPDGTVVVLRAHVERILGEALHSKTTRKTAPRLELVA